MNLLLKKIYLQNIENKIVQDILLMLVNTIRSIYHFSSHIDNKLYDANLAFKFIILIDK